MHELRDMFAILTAGTIFLATIIASGMGLWYALSYNHIITMSLVALYGVTQMFVAYRKYPKQNLHGKWFLFWFDNEWYKLVLLLTGMWALLEWT